jgi:hypothetical protein
MRCGTMWLIHAMDLLAPGLGPGYGMGDARKTIAMTGSVIPAKAGIHGPQRIVSSHNCPGLQPWDRKKTAPKQPLNKIDQPLLSQG